MTCSGASLLLSIVITQIHACNYNNYANKQTMEKLKEIGLLAHYNY